MSALRGLYSSKTKIRNQIFTEVARFAYEGGDYSKFENLPYEIIPGEISTYREVYFSKEPLSAKDFALQWDCRFCPFQNKRLSQQVLKKV